MKLKNMPIVQDAAKIFQHVKEKSTNDNFLKNRQNSQAKRKESIAAVDEKKQTLEARKLLNVDAKTFKAINSEDYRPLNFDQVAKYYDRILASQAKQGSPLTSKDLVAMAHTIASDETHADWHNKLTEKVDAAIKGCTISQTRKDLATQFAKHMINNLFHDPESKQIYHELDLTALDKLALADSKKDPIKRFIGKKMSKLAVQTKIAGMNVPIAAKKMRQAGSVTAEKAHKASASALAGSAVALVATAATAATPVVGVAKTISNIGKGVAKGAVAAGQSIASATRKDANAFANQFKDGTKQQAAGGKKASTDDNV